MNRLKVYLSGAMSGLTFEEMNGWREEAKQLFSSMSDIVTVINPVDFYNFNMNPNTYTELEVMRFDLKSVSESDIILFNKDFPNSIGTAIELYHAYENKIPVVAYGIERNHPWMECCIDKTCKTIEEAIEYILEFYVPILYKGNVR